MKKDVAKMSLDEVEREWRDFGWEYIALSDRAQTDEYYAEHAAKLDERKKELLARLLSREKEGGLTQHTPDAAYAMPCPECAEVGRHHPDCSFSGHASR